MFLRPGTFDLKSDVQDLWLNVFSLWKTRLFKEQHATSITTKKASV